MPGVPFDATASLCALTRDDRGTPFGVGSTVPVVALNLLQRQTTQ